MKNITGNGKFSIASGWWLYLLGLVLTAAGIIAFANNAAWIAVAPLAIAAFWLAVNHTTAYTLLLCFMVPLSVQFEDIGMGLGISLPSEPLIMLLFGLLMLRALSGGEFRKEAFLHPVSIVIGAWLIWIGITTLTSTMKMVSFKFFLNRAWYVGIFYFLMLYIFRDRKKIHWYFAALAASTLIVVLYTLGRHAAENFVRSYSYSIMQPFFREHGTYAAALAFLVPVLAAYVISGDRFKLHIAARSFIALALLILLFGIVVSFTRAAWVSLVVSLLMWLVFLMRIRFRWMMLALLAVVGYLGINNERILYELERNKQGSADELESHLESVSNISTDPSNLERINRWKSALRMTAEKPLTGFGPGTFVFQYGPYQSSQDMTIISVNSGTLGDAHSEYFSALSEQGIPGLLFLVALILLITLRAMRVIYQNEHIRSRILGTAAYLGLLTYFVHGFLNNYSVYDKIAVPMWGFMAVIVALDLYHTDAGKAEQDA